MFTRVLLVALCLGSIVCVAQDTANGAEELARVSRELKETQSELTESRRQIEELRRGLDALRTQVQGRQSSEPTVGSEAAATAGESSTLTSEPTAASADENISFLAAKVAELHQDKVESASKFPVKVSGLVLFNAYRNSGTMDIQDLPNLTFQNFRGHRMAALAARCARPSWGSMRRGRNYLGRGRRRVWQWILAEAVPLLPMEWRLGWCDCGRQNCRWTGNIRRFTLGRMRRSFHLCLQLHMRRCWSRRWRGQGICGCGLRPLRWNIEFA